jgi:hypothetical protein
LQAFGRLLPNAKPPVTGDDGALFYYMDGLVVAQVLSLLALQVQKYGY